MGSLRAGLSGVGRMRAGTLEVNWEEDHLQQCHLLQCLAPILALSQNTIMIFICLLLLFRLWYWASEASPHTSESQLRSDMYICLYHQKFKGQCVSIPSKFKGQCVSIPSGYVQRSTLTRVGLHVRVFFAHIPL